MSLKTRLKLEAHQEFRDSANCEPLPNIFRVPLKRAPRDGPLNEIWVTMYKECSRLRDYLEGQNSGKAIGSLPICVVPLR